MPPPSSPPFSQSITATAICPVPTLFTTSISGINEINGTHDTSWPQYSPKKIHPRKERKKTEPWPGETAAIQLSATQLFTQSMLLLYCLLLFHSRHSDLCHFDCKFVSQNEQFSTGVCVCGEREREISNFQKFFPFALIKKSSTKIFMSDNYYLAFAVNVTNLFCLIQDTRS